MLKKQPLVSICIPTYMGQQFIERTLRSALNQTYSNIEIIVLNDNSSDDTEKIVSCQNDERIKYFRNSTNVGPEGNWNECLKRATGKYFKLLPHDDILSDSCVEKQVAVMEADLSDKISLVFGKRQIIDADDNFLMTRGLPYKTEALIRSTDLIRICVKSGTNRIGEPGNCLIRTELARNVGFYDAQYPYLVDLDYWFRILMHGDAFYTATHSSSFRISASSWSAAIGSRQFADFNNFVSKYRNQPVYKIRSSDALLGYINSAINTIGRLIVYKILFKSK